MGIQIQRRVKATSLSCVLRLSSGQACKRAQESFVERRTDWILDALLS